MALKVHLPEDNSSLMLELSDADYWLLYGLFEDIENSTDMLVEPADNTLIEFGAIPTLKQIVAERLETLDKKPAQDSLLESDDERLTTLLNGLLDLIDLAITKQGPLKFSTDEAEN